MQSMKLKENKTMELEKSLNEYLEKIEKYLKPLIVSEREIGRASCRERV